MGVINSLIEHTGNITFFFLEHYHLLKNFQR